MCQFGKQSMETKIILTLMAQDVNEFKEQDKEYPIEVRNILDDFSDLWTVELPNQLPLMRNIQLTTSLLIAHNYFENYRFVSQHWKLSQNLIFVFYEIEEVSDIQRSYLTMVQS